MHYTIRPMKEEEYPLLKNFLYEAIFQKDEKHLFPFDIIQDPKLNVYIENFGRENDNCIVAESEEKLIGAVWTRIINGYGKIDEVTPELAISLYKKYRGQGIGTELMKAILDLLRKRDYKKVSLSVQKDNYASKMYVKLGFEIIAEDDEEFIMVYRFMN